MELLPLLGTLALALSLSFFFWIFVAYGLTRFLRLGVCSVCGAVVTVWVANLVFAFLPGWVTVLLMGQSVVGGASLFRDELLSRALPADTPNPRRILLAQLTWFAFILGGTAVLGTLALLFAWEPRMELREALAGVLLLDGVLLASFVLSVLLVFATWNLAGVRVCQVCLAVSGVWVLNLFLQLLPPWTSVLLIGQSVAGGAALGRDWAAERLRAEERPERERRLVKQGAYFAFLLAGTLAAAVICLLFVPGLAP